MLHPAPKSREMPGGTSHRQSLFAVPVGVGKRLSTGLFGQNVYWEGGLMSKGSCNLFEITRQHGQGIKPAWPKTNGQKQSPLLRPTDQASRPNNLQNSWKWHVSTDKALKSLGSS